MILASIPGKMITMTEFMFDRREKVEPGGPKGSGLPYTVHRIPMGNEAEITVIPRNGGFEAILWDEDGNNIEADYNLKSIDAVKLFIILCEEIIDESKGLYVPVTDTEGLS